jgi:hypothetical protein
MVAFAALLKHSNGEIGDGKSYASAEWLQQLCAGIAGYSTLQRLSLRRMVLTSATPASAHAGLHGLSAVLRDSLSLVSVQLASCGLESRHLLPLVAEIQSSPIRLKELDLSGNKTADEGLVELANVFSVSSRHNNGPLIVALDCHGLALMGSGPSMAVDDRVMPPLIALDCP